MDQITSTILPTLSATIAERTSNDADASTKKIDLATAENWLLRPELVALCKEAFERNLNDKVRQKLFVIFFRGGDFGGKARGLEKRYGGYEERELFTSYIGLLCFFLLIGCPLFMGEGEACSPSPTRRDLGANHDC